MIFIASVCRSPLFFFDSPSPFPFSLCPFVVSCSLLMFSSWFLILSIPLSWLSSRDLGFDVYDIFVLSLGSLIIDVLGLFFFFRKISWSDSTWSDHYCFIFQVHSLWATRRALESWTSYWFLRLLKESGVSWFIFRLHFRIMDLNWKIEDALQWRDHLMKVWTDTDTDEKNGIDRPNRSLSCRSFSRYFSVTVYATRRVPIS